MTNHNGTVRAIEDSDDAWILDQAIAVVVTAPSSIYDPDRTDYDDRYAALTTSFEQQFFPSAQRLLHLPATTPSRGPYRLIPPNTGGMFPSLADLYIFARDVDEIGGILGNALALAEVGRFAARLWKRCISQSGEHARVEHDNSPLLSLPILKALCIADVIQCYGAVEDLTIETDTWPTRYGNHQHPIGGETHVVAVRFGRELAQKIIYIMDSMGRCLYKLGTDCGTPLTIQALAPPNLADMAD